MKIFVDTNILVDTLVSRVKQSFTANSALFLSLKENYPGFQLCVSIISLSTCFYFLKDKPNSGVKMESLTKNIEILDSTKEDFDFAIKSNNKDLEDALQYSIAKRYECDIIITRDQTGFRGFPIQSMTPESFLTQLGVNCLKD